MAAAVDVDAELVVRFDDAVIFCDQRLHRGALAPGLLPAYGNDAALIAFTERHPEAESSRLITTGPHQGEIVPIDGNSSTNACIHPTSIAAGAISPNPLRWAPYDGFCRADFNYCLGMELSLHAQSLPTGGSQTPLKAALLRVARERLQAAGVEYLASFAFYQRACFPPPPGTIDPLYELECGPKARLAAGYADVAHDRLLESISRIVTLAPTEAGLRVDLGDRALRAFPTDEAAVVQALYGPSGSRTSGVAALYGPPDGVKFETEWNLRRLRPVALPSYLPSDDHPARVIELLRRHRAPTPFVRPKSETINGIGPRCSARAGCVRADFRVSAGSRRLARLASRRREAQIGLQGRLKGR